MTVVINGIKGWEAWLEQCLAPIGETGVGEDPRYDDRFSQLKAEVEKKQDVDFELITSLATEVLTKDSKDLRAAAYFTMGAARQHGLSGFSAGIEALHRLLATFGADCHPQKPRARAGALKWILQPKVLTFLKDYADKPAADEVTEAIEQFEKLVSAAGAEEVEDFGWKDLTTWLESHKPKPEAQEPSQPANAAQTPVSTPAQPASAAAMPGNGSIQSDADLAQAQKQLLGYYRDKKVYGAMVALARGFKWGELKIPPSEGGKTRVPAPRQASLNRVAAAIEQEDWENAFLAAEDAFLEPGGLYCFDLQRHAATAAAKAGHKGAATQIERMVLAALDRCPKIRQLKFDNDEPFISGATQGWLEQIAPADSDDDEQKGRDLLAEGRQKRDDETLGDALKWLSEQASSTGVERVKVRLAQAQLCHEAGEAALAEPLLAQLDSEVETLGLARLMPELAMAIWRQRWMVLNDVKSQSSTEDVETIDNELGRLKSQMCATDLAKAINWF